MFFDHYPYTNFHNINLDWVLQAVKAWGQTVEANDRAFQDLKEANEDFKAYVTNYLQDLDITDEINTKLDTMLASGVLTPYFAPYVQGYVNSWLNSHVTPTSPALDNNLTLSGAAARADAVGHRLKDLAYIDALSTPEVYAAINRNQVMPGYRVQGITYDYDGHFYVCGGSVDEDGTGAIVKMTSPDFKDAEMTVIQQLGHANDITYYDGYLYVCTVGGGDAPQWGIYKINVNDFTDKTLISNAPENTIGITYRQGDFWLLAPYRIYRTTDFTSYEVIVDNTNNLMTAYGIPTSGRISQTIFRTAGYLIGWVCSFVFEERHYGAITFFSSTGQPVAFKMFPAYHSELQGAVYADMSIWLLADGDLVNVFRMDPRHLSYIQLKAGDDLNDFTGRGTLYSTGSNISGALINSPTSGEGFTVQVERLGVYNTIQTARTNSGRELYRVKSFSAGTWGEWIEPASEVAQVKEDLSAVTDIITNGNFFPAVTIAETVKNGVTYSAKDGWYSFNGTASSTFLIDIPGLPNKLAGGHTYLFSTGGFNGAVYLRLTDTNNNNLFQKARSQRITIPSGTTIKFARFYIATSKTADNIRIKPTIALADEVSDDAPASALTIIDDDGAVGFYSDVLPVIQTKNVPIATSVIPTYASGSSTNYMRWSRVEECYLAGAEVLCHTYDHSDTPDQEAKPMAQIQREFQMARNLFLNKGYDSNILVYAGGTGNIHKVYDAGCNTFPYAINSGVGLANYSGSIDPHNVYRISVTFSDDELDTLKAQIDEARALRGCWLVWMFHTSAGEWSSANAAVLTIAIDYARSVGLDIITADAGFRRFINSR